VQVTNVDDEYSESAVHLAAQAPGRLMMSPGRESAAQPAEIQNMDAVEEPHLGDFRAFYESLPPGPHWFMFFTSGLLNIVDRALRFLPQGVSVVLVGSSLPEEELGWLRRAHPECPFHHVPLLIDDKTIWEFLFATATEDFGWIDVDCFILDSSLLDEMQEPGDRVALSGTFCFAPRPLLRTHLLWTSIDAVARLRAEVPTSPTTYSYTLTHAQRYPEHSFCRILRADHIAHIGKVIDLDDRNQPVVGQSGILELYSNGITLQSSERSRASEVFSGSTRRLFPIYDTLVVAQLVLQSLGYQSRVVRGGISDISAAAVHWKSISYHRRIGQDLGDLTASERQQVPRHHRWTLLADALLMFEFLETPDPPGRYDRYARFLSDRLAQEGFTLRTARTELARHLTDAGVDAATLRADERWRFLHSDR